LGSFASGVINTTVSTSSIGLVMACFNLVDSIFSFILGKITDAFGLKPMLYIGGTAHVIFYSFFIFYFQYSSLENLANNQYLIYLSVSIASIGDATCNVFSASAIGIHFEGKLEMAYANNRMFQTIGFIASFFYGTYGFSMQLQLIIQLVLLAITSASMVPLFLFLFR